MAEKSSTKKAKSTANKERPLTSPQFQLLMAINSQPPGEWAEIAPKELKTAQSLVTKGLIDLVCWPNNLWVARAVPEHMRRLNLMQKLMREQLEEASRNKIYKIPMIEMLLLMNSLENYFARRK